jgi:hypothetical protein
VEGVGVNLIEFVHDGLNLNRSPVATAYTESLGEYRFHPSFFSGRSKMRQRQRRLQGVDRFDLGCHKAGAHARSEYASP